jgi:hypothetical protein
MSSIRLYGTCFSVHPSSYGVSALILYREEEVNHAALIGDMEAMEALDSEYAAGSEVFRAKIASLKAMYASIRRARAANGAPETADAGGIRRTR